MRILAGLARGLPLRAPPGLATRPILDRLKKSLFSILESRNLIKEQRVLDLYAGSGALGLEALSRGAAWCLFVEAREEALAALRDNLTRARFADRAEARRGNVAAALAELASRAGPRFGLIFLDPPFAFSRENDRRPALQSELALCAGLLADEGCLTLRLEKASEPPPATGLTLARRWSDGPHAFCFYAPDASLKTPPQGRPAPAGRP